MRAELVALGHGPKLVMAASCPLLVLHGEERPPIHCPCRHVRMCHTRADLAALGHGPKLVLATLATLEAGGSRQLLVEWAANPANLLLFPGRAPVRAGIVRHRAYS